MKKILIVLLAVLFQGFVMANEVEHQTLAEKYGYDKLTTEELEKEKKRLETETEMLINTIEATTTLSKTEILMFILMYDKFGYKAVYEAYCIFYDVILEDWEVDLYIEGCIRAGIAGGLYTLEFLAGKVPSKQ